MGSWDYKTDISYIIRCHNTVHALTYLDVTLKWSTRTESHRLNHITKKKQKNIWDLTYTCKNDLYDLWASLALAIVIFDEYGKDSCTVCEWDLTLLTRFRWE